MGRTELQLVSHGWMLRRIARRDDYGYAVNALFISIKYVSSFTNKPTGRGRNCKTLQVKTGGGEGRGQLDFFFLNSLKCKT